MPHPLMPTDLPISKDEAQASFLGEMQQLQGKIEVTAYNPGWLAQFEEEAAAIRRILGDQVLELEHVGSTSVPGLPAKPILDIDLVVDDSTDESAYVPVLEAAGYKLTIREPHWHEHRMLKRLDPAVNLHVWTLEVRKRRAIRFSATGFVPTRPTAAPMAPTSKRLPSRTSGICMSTTMPSRF